MSTFVLVLVKPLDEAEDVWVSSLRTLEFIESKSELVWTVADLALKIVSLPSMVIELLVPSPVISVFASVNTLEEEFTVESLKLSRLLAFIFVTFAVIFPLESPILLLIHPPVGQEFVWALPILKIDSEEDFVAEVPLTLEDVPNLVLEPKDNEEVLPVLLEVLTVLPAMLSKTSPETISGNSIVWLFNATLLKEAIDKKEKNMIL